MKYTAQSRVRGASFSDWDLRERGSGQEPRVGRMGQWRLGLVTCKPPGNIESCDDDLGETA